jgi:hypothetical protein
VLKGLGFVAQSGLIGATAFIVLAIPRGIRADSTQCCARHRSS